MNVYIVSTQELIFHTALHNKEVHVGYTVVISLDEEEDSGSDNLPNIKHPRIILNQIH